VVYYKQKLHKVGYFKELMMTNPDIREGLRPLLTICRETIVRLGKTEGALVRSLAREPLLSDRVERLMTIPAVGPITALTWVLEVDDVARFGSVKQAVSYWVCAQRSEVQPKWSSARRSPSRGTSTCNRCWSKRPSLDRG